MTNIAILASGNGSNFENIVKAVRKGHIKVKIKLLITDKNSAVDILDQRSRAKGIVKGFKENLCKIDYMLLEEDLRIWR